MFPVPVQHRSPDLAGRWAVTAILCLLLLAALALPVAAVKPAPVILDPKTIPKYVNQLVKPPAYVAGSGADPNTDYYTISMRRGRQQILPAGTPLVGTTDGKTAVWGYYQDTAGGTIGGSPGATFEATRGKPVSVKWVNEITGAHPFAVDPTLHWANPNMIPMPGMMNAPVAPYPLFPPGFDGTQENPLGFFYDAQSPIPLVTHLHGGEVHSTSDGHPDAWWTAAATNVRGPAFNSLPGNAAGEAIFSYPNEQPPTTLWYHDHALGITRLNVMSGLAGFYLLRDSADTVAPLLPSGPNEVPIVIQDRTFQPNGEFWFPTAGLNPATHPYWMPEFFGNTIMVNGKVWPYMNVVNHQYRFRFLDGSNARFYTLSFSNKMPFTIIGTDGGYLKAPVTVTEFSMAPGERYDVLVDFSNIPVGTQINLTNTAKAPTPRGAPADPATTGQIMQFRVTTGTGWAPQTLPAPLNPTLAGPTFPNLPTPTVTRVLTLQEVMGAAGPVEILLDGQKWAATVNETPASGATEDWVIINPTADTHPIHLHLVQFQLLKRQPFQANKYQKQWLALNGMPPLTGPTKIVSPTPYLQGAPVGPLPQEQGWKDTIQVRPGEVTTIRVRFAPIGGGAYPFNPTTGPGYVWHCHILDHEDNEMMRPYKVTA